MANRTYSDYVKELQDDLEYWQEAAKLEFALVVHGLMESRGIKRKDLAQRLATTQAYVTKVLRGDANLSIASQVKIVRALDAKLHVHVTENHRHERWVKVISQAREPARAWQAPSAPTATISQEVTANAKYLAA